MTTIVDGKHIANVCAKALRVDEEAQSPVLHVVIAGNDPVTANFVGMKARFAERIGFTLQRHTFPETVTTEELIACLQELEAQEGGIIVQLPLPPQVDQVAVIAEIPSHKDIDVLNPKTFEAFLSETTPLVPPVAAAVWKVLSEHAVDVTGKHVVVLGKGKLVGTPVRALLSRHGAYVNAVDIDTPKEEIIELLTQADIVVSGIGVPGFVQPDMLKDGVVLIDAGTSSSRGTVEGDIDTACTEKASLFSKTPGGVGPVTVAMLFTNLLKVTQ